MSEIKKIKIGNETYNIGVEGIRTQGYGDGFSLYDKNRPNTDIITFNFTNYYISSANYINIDVLGGIIGMGNKTIRLTTGTTTPYFDIPPYDNFVTFNRTPVLKDLLQIKGSSSAIRTEHFDLEFLDNGLRLNFFDNNPLTITRTESTSSSSSSSSTITTLPPTTTTKTTT